jgi:hypothetical protein
MSVETSKRKSVEDLTKVETKSSTQTIDLSKRNIALHIGQCDTHHDFLLAFCDAEVLIRGETKFTSTGSQIAFSGKSSNTFQHEQELSESSPCKLANNYFIFITNGWMTEKNKEKIVHEKSMFVNGQRWIAAFSPLFDFVNYI